MRTTPFHPRLAELDTEGLWTHWQGTLSALRYSHAPKHEYFAVRNGVGVFDTSPLFSYDVRGADAERLLTGALVRDVRTCAPGQAQYTLWCDDRGFVAQDGVVLRHAADRFTLTAARPALGWFTALAEGLDVTVDDVSDRRGILAVQGPRSRTVLAELTPAVTDLAYFHHTETTVAGRTVTLSRTGYTGDLGYELTVAADDALAVLDAVLEAGRPHSVRPFGEEALMLLRIEAGLPLIDVEWHDTTTAEADHQRVTPHELGMGWMVRGDRSFVGSAAIAREVATASSRWATTGIVVDWAAWDALHRDAGLRAPKSERPAPYESLLLDAAGAGVGYCTSFVYSPVLQRHVGLARVRPDLAAPGTDLRLEVAVAHRNHTVGVRTTRLPFFDPERKRA